jgi:hypothetical protein
VPPFNLAGCGRRPRRSQQVFDAVLPANTVKQDFSGAGPNRPVNTFPLSVKICSGTPYVRIASSKPSHIGRAVALETTCALIMNLEWSSIPDTIFAPPPPASMTPPTMSICHNSIELERSHRL